MEMYSKTDGETFGYRKDADKKFKYKI